MSEELVSIVRTYIEDPSEPFVVSTSVIERWLNKSRQAIYDLRIYPEDYYYDNVSKVYSVGYQYLMNVVIKDGDDNTIASTNYDIDVFNGIVTFKTAYTVPDAIYINFTTHDFFDAVCNIWLYRAGLATTMKKAQIGDEILPEDKNSLEYCTKKYWSFRQSVSRQMERD